MKYIDTHAHLNLDQFSGDLDAVLGRMNEAGVGAINIGTHRASSERAVALAAQYEDQYAMVGVHPCNVLESDPDDQAAVPPEPVFDYAFYKTLAQNERVVGIGECGFDYFHQGDETYKAQREVFVAQLALAKELKKPVMLHLRNRKDGSGRNAYEDALDILRAERGVVVNAHFYAGTYEQAKAFIELGGTVSFTGVITFAAVYEPLVRDLPLDRIHAETDCPYVAPVPYRGQRAEPWMVIEVYKKIAAIKGLEEEVVREQLLKNAQTLYGI